MFNLGVIPKSGFFDRTAVLRQLNAAERQVLSKIGAYVRRRAQTSMWRRKRGASAPGSPPFAHVGHLRKFLYFAWDANTRTVVVGPVRFKSGASREVPALHEFGGRRVRKGPKGGTKPAVYPPRPYMRPALLAERPRFAAQFRNSIR